MKNNDIGKVILKLRQEKGLNQKMLGDKLGYSQRTISDWEHGNTEPNLDAIRRIALFFDISYEELLDS